MEITIGFCKGKGNSLVTRSIRFLDRSHASHVYCVLADGNVFHAHEENINVMEYKDLFDHYVLLDEFKIDLELDVYNRIDCFCKNRIFKKYSKKSVVGVGLNRVLGVKNFLWEPEKQNCAEHTGRILNIMGAGIPESEFKTMGIRRVHDELSKMKHQSNVRWLPHVS